MKKLLYIIVTLLVTCYACSGYAMVQERQASIANISQQMSLEDVHRAHGDSYTRISLARNRFGVQYNDGLYVEFTGNAVSYIEVNKNKNLTTYDGLHVGSTMGNVEDALGRADYIDGNFHVYQASGKKDIAFVYDKGNKVVLIYSGLSYEDEENIRKNKDKDKKTNNGNPVRDPLRNYEIASYRLRNIYWNLKSVFNHHGHCNGWNWGWGFPRW